MRHAAMTAMLLSFISLAGCSTDSSTPTSPTGPSAVALRVNPADGATDVAPDASVILTFATAVDRDLVQGNMHLISEQAMADSTCPDSASMTHLGMAHSMEDPAMMSHLDTYHSTPGHFSWSEDGTVCTFRPEEMMSSSTLYMIHMSPGMMDMIGNSGRDRMDGHGSGMMADHMMLHFTTMDAP